MIFTAICRAQVEPEWVSTYQVPGALITIANALALDRAGNVYVAGYSWGSTTGENFLVVSFGPSGILRWVYRIRGTDSLGTNEATSIVVDRSGNVYAAGYCEDLGTGRDMVVVNLSSNGNVRWRYQYNGPGNDVDGASCIALGKGEKNIYVGGYSTGVGTMFDFTVVSFDSGSGKEGVYRRNGTADQWDEVMAIACDSTSVYASGYTRNTGTSMDFTVVRLDTSAQERWAYTYNGPEDSWDESYDLTVDKAGDMYAAGYSRQSGALMDWAVIKVDTGGLSPWHLFYKGAADSMDWAERIIVDETGVYSAGTTSGLGTGFDMSLVKLDSLGKTLWVYNYDGPANSDDEGYGLAMDEMGNFYVAGYSSGSSWDLTVASVDSSGTERWVYRYDGEGKGGDVATMVKSDSAGYIYACGTTMKSDDTSALVVVKLKTNPPHGVAEKPKPARRRAVPGLMAAGRISFDGPVEIFDHTGRLIISHKDKASVTVNNLAAGVYFLRTKEGDRMQWRKVVILK